MSILQNYFKNIYERTMTEAYALAHIEIINAMKNGGQCLDCGASTGGKFTLLKNKLNIETEQYTGIEWSKKLVDEANKKGLNLIQGDLNQNIPLPDDMFDCVFGLSVLEHLLNPCKYMQECHRVLKKGGTLILLTPNISTYFTAILILLGKMPSSGPHPDSDFLIKNEEIFKVSSEQLQPDSETDTPSHRHLIVFSFRVLNSYLKQIGFRSVDGHGFGIYPFPNIIQPVLEKIDPYHSHQMVFIARK